MTVVAEKGRKTAGRSNRALKDSSLETVRAAWVRAMEVR